MPVLHEDLRESSPAWPAPRVSPASPAPSVSNAALARRATRAPAAARVVDAPTQDADVELSRALARAALQRQETETAPAPPAAASLTDRLIAALDVHGPVDYDAIMADIRAGSLAERRAALESDRVRDLLRDRLGGEWAHTAMATLLEGAQRWVNPPANDFFDYFVTTRGTGRLPSTASMNCWEMVLYSAYLVGQLDQPWIERFYRTALAAPDPNVLIWQQLGWSASLPRYPATTPRPGQLLFYDSGGAYPGHVALSLGGDQAISLWNEPRGDRATQRIRVDELAGTVTVGDAPW